MAIVQVTNCNADKWAELCNELWPHHSISEIMEAFDMGYYNNEYLYQTEGVFTAFISLSVRNDYVEGTDSRPVAYLEGIYVKPEYRKKGIAKEMVNFAKQWAAKNGCSMLASDCELTNNDSRVFHNKIGFKEASINVHFTMNINE